MAEGLSTFYVLGRENVEGVYDYVVEKYGEESFERVVLLRAFPVEKPNEFISVKTPDERSMLPIQFPPKNISLR